MGDIEKYPPSVHEISALLSKAYKGSFENADDNQNNDNKSNIVIRSTETVPESINSSENSVIATNNNPENRISEEKNTETNKERQRKKSLLLKMHEQSSIFNDSVENKTNGKLKTDKGQETSTKVDKDLKNVESMNIQSSKIIERRDKIASPNKTKYDKTIDVQTNNNLKLNNDLRSEENKSSNAFANYNNNSVILAQVTSVAPLTNYKTASDEGNTAQSRNTIFKKSHTCGSLFANCTCGDGDVDNVSNKFSRRLSLIHTGYYRGPNEKSKHLDTPHPYSPERSNSLDSRIARKKLLDLKTEQFLSHQYPDRKLRTRKLSKTLENGTKTSDASVLTPDDSVLLSDLDANTEQLLALPYTDRKLRIRKLSQQSPGVVYVDNCSRRPSEFSQEEDSISFTSSDFNVASDIEPRKFSENNSRSFENSPLRNKKQSSPEFSSRNNNNNFNDYRNNQENIHITCENIRDEIVPYPTLSPEDNICLRHPDRCWNHPEIPFPIPPKEHQTIKQNIVLRQKSEPTTSNNETKIAQFRRYRSQNSGTDSKHSDLIIDQKLAQKIIGIKKSAETQTPYKKKSSENQNPPLSLSTVLQHRDYIPDFPETNYLAINVKENPTRQTEDSENPAEVYYKESGIFGMGTGVSALIRKNSKILCQDTNTVETIRKSSKILAENAAKRRSSSIPDDYEYLRTVVPHLKKELAEWEQKAGLLEGEVFTMRRELQNREAEVLKLQREVHKLKSVLQQATSFAQDGDLLASLQEQHGMANRTTNIHQYQGSSGPGNNYSCNASNVGKKQGVSAESSDCMSGQQACDIQITRYDKDFRSKQLIKDAIMDNDFLKNLDSSQVRELVDSMYPREFPAGSYVIREGEAGAHLFVSAEGEFEVIKENTVLGKMGSGKAFGELAILYNCTRTASIRVVSDSKVWVLDRRVFQQIMMRTGLQRLQDNISFLRSVPLLRNLSCEVLAKISDVLEVEFYPADAYIIRQGASGDTFFIISGGSVKVTQRLPGCSEESEIRTLSRGDYFGEQALLKEDCRTASVLAMHPGVECLTLDRDSFIQLIGDLSELQEKDYGDDQRTLNRPSSAISVALDNGQELEHIRLDDLDVIATLGVGGFGRVELVQYAHDRTQTFALKCLKKQHIVDTQQQEHVFSEKGIMISCRSPFICRLYKTFRDAKYVYMLLEACLGGEVWTILRDRGCFDDHTTRFVTACVIEAFEYLHARGIIYRDLKPENLLLDSRGYVKLVDFGFSKKLGHSSKTWTFCGTPEYVAPETILNKGHDRAVDYWALGVLMHELLTGTPPFTASDPMKTYNIILKGIDMIDFPKHITRAAQSLIKRLCRDSPAERLGYQRGGIQDIKKHKWFQGFDWDGLKARTLQAPLIQPVRGPCDSSNFDCYAKDNDIPPDELSNWDMDF